MSENLAKYILMYQNDRVLSFTVDFKLNKVHVLQKLEHFEKAPYVMNDEKQGIDFALRKFINSRTIATNRYDFQRILEATGCKGSIELSFKGHGLSLTSHYWYQKDGENLRYEDINFFTNKWDDSFARCILNGDYEGLKHCSLNVPDILTSGWAAKGWIYDNGPKLCKLGLTEGEYEDCLGEVLASRLARRLLNENEVNHYELMEFNGKYASVTPTMIGLDEELVPLSVVLPFEIYTIYRAKNTDKKYLKVFFDKVKEFGIDGISELFVKISVLKSLGFITDLHFDNISMIRNIKTGQMRFAPLYDLAGAFGSSSTGRKFVANADAGTYALIYFMYSGLDPEWDYSWYNPDKLVGFEDDIKEVLSKSSFYTPEIIERIIDVYRHQKETLDEISSKSKKSKQC